MRRLAGLSAPQQVLAALVAAIVVGALAVAVPVLGNAAMLLACAALLAVLAVLALWLWGTRRATDWSNTFTEGRPPRGADSRVTRLVRVVATATDGHQAAAQQLHVMLTGLAGERLRDRRGLRLEADPDAAHTALGPALTAYLIGPPTTRLTAAQLDTHITTLEEL
jgi:hypothetical protein